MPETILRFAVKAAGVKYLPRLEAQTDEEYAAFQSRACFFNATRRAADAFVGLVFRKAQFVRIPGGGRTTGPRDGGTTGHGGGAQGVRAGLTPPESPPQALPKPFQSYCTAMIQLLHSYCTAIAQLLHSYCTAIARL